MGNEPSTFIYLLISFDRWTQPESNYPILLFEVKDWITSIDPLDYNFLVRTCNVRFNLKQLCLFLQDSFASVCEWTGSNWTAQYGKPCHREPLNSIVNQNLKFIRCRNDFDFDILTASKNDQDDFQKGRQ